MAASAPIMVADSASVITAATTIFNRKMDEGFVELRAQRKDITKAITVFVNSHRALAALPEQERRDFAMAEQIDDCDQEWKDLIANLNNWVDAAHEKLDLNNQFDKSMLENIATYVERAALAIGGAPFFRVQQPEIMDRCVIYKRRHRPSLRPRHAWEGKGPIGR